MKTFYYTFGDSDTQPYVGGWVEIEAESENEANAVFVCNYGLTSDGWMPCAFVYTEEAFISSGMAESGNRGAKCHQRLARTADGWSREKVSV